MKPEEKQQKILQILLRELEHSKFTEFTLGKAAAEAEVTSAELKLLFDGGLLQVAKMLFAKHQTELNEAITAMPKEGVTSNIKRSVMLSFQLFEPHKTALRKILKFLIMPLHAPNLPTMLYKEVDLIWKANGIGDSSFKFYTKRLSLGAIYATCFSYFVLSKNHEKLEAILEKQLGILKFLISKVKF